jgi:hypothetical protein
MRYNTEEFSPKNARPTVLWSYVLDDYQRLNQQLETEIDQYRTNNPKNYTDAINVNVWQSDWEMHQRPVFNFITDKAKEFTKIISAEYFNFPIFNPEIVDCWINLYNKDSGCRVHQHFPATFSLVYYIKVPEKSGDIYFPDIGINLTPTPGLLLCFRGDTWHGVQFNFTENDRIIMGINIVHKNS